MKNFFVGLLILASYNAIAQDDHYNITIEKIIDKTVLYKN